MHPEFRQGEKVRHVPLPCCECGADSKAYASLADGGWLCACCAEQDETCPACTEEAEAACERATDRVIATEAN